MCSIIAGFKKEDIENLIDLNQYRGNFSFSYTDFKNNNPEKQIKSFGEFNKSVIDNSENYKVCHVQSPTGGMIKDLNRIHPSEIGGSMLWHNGLLTPRGIKFLQEKLPSDNNFDTYLLHEGILNFGFEILSEIEGLFSCLLFLDNKFFIFRTKHGKLYIDKNLNISSEKFKGSRCIPYDTIYSISLENLKISRVEIFKTKRFNVLISGEDIESF